MVTSDQRIAQHMTAGRTAAVAACAAHRGKLPDASPRRERNWDKRRWRHIRATERPMEVADDLPESPAPARSERPTAGAPPVGPHRTPMGAVPPQNRRPAPPQDQ